MLARNSDQPLSRYIINHYFFYHLCELLLLGDVILSYYLFLTVGMISQLVKAKYTSASEQDFYIPSFLQTMENGQFHSTCRLERSFPIVVLILSVHIITSQCTSSVGKAKMTCQKSVFQENSKLLLILGALSDKIQGTVFVQIFIVCLLNINHCS